MTVIMIGLCWIIPCLILQFMSGYRSSSWWGYGAIGQAGLVIIYACLRIGMYWQGIIMAAIFAWLWNRNKKDKKHAKQLIGNKIRAIKARMARDLADRSIPVPSRRQA